MVISKLVFSIHGLLSLYLVESVIFNFRSRYDIYGNNWQEHKLDELHKTMRLSYQIASVAETREDHLYYKESFYYAKTQIKLIAQKVLEGHE